MIVHLSAVMVASHVIAAFGWVAGTATGAIAGSLLPISVRDALGVMLYGMFVAIVIPRTRHEKPIRICAVVALLFSCLFTWTPKLNQISGGLIIVICTVATAALCALLFPVEEAEA